MDFRLSPSTLSHMKQLFSIEKSQSTNDLFYYEESTTCLRKFDLFSICYILATTRCSSTLAVNMTTNFRKKVFYMKAEKVFSGFYLYLICLMQQLMRFITNESSNVITIHLIHFISVKIKPSKKLL